MPATATATGTPYVTRRMRHRRGPTLTVVPARRPELVVVPKSGVDEAQIELLVSRDDRLTHTEVIRRHLRVAMRAIGSGHYAAAATWLDDLDRLNEQEAVRARATTVEAKPCPDCEDCVRVPGHGRAA